MATNTGGGARPLISVVLPCYNEVDNLVPLIAELKATLDRLGKPYEVIYVDDCSTDGTTDKLEELVRIHPFLRHVLHNRNMGESAGTLTGIEVARGSIIVTMDADLQNDPADIPRMLRIMRAKKADAVCGVRGRRNDSLGKRLSSRLANFFRDLLLGDGIHDAGCTFRVLRKSALRQLVGFKATHRFLPTMMKWHGYRVVETTINHRPRTRGVSKYGFGNRFWVGILDIIGMRWYRRRFVPPDRIARITEYPGKAVAS